MELYGSGAVLSHYMMNINEIATDALLRFGNVLRTVDNNGLTDYRLLDRAMNLMNRSFHDIETVMALKHGRSRPSGPLAADGANPSKQLV